MSEAEAKKYPDFIETCRFGYVDGICGANCRHSFSVYVEGMNNPFEKYDSEENRILYEKEQRQRLLERRIRYTKQKVLGMQEAVDKCPDERAKFELQQELDRKSALLQKQNKAYQDYCRENNLRPLSDRIQIARWNRQEAAKAIGAAKRYNNGKGE